MMASEYSRSTSQRPVEVVEAVGDGAIRDADVEGDPRSHASLMVDEANADERSIDELKESMRDSKTDRAASPTAS